jgi:hypothetical protein
MVKAIEIVVLLVVLGVALRWFTRTSLFRGARRNRTEIGQDGRGPKSWWQ